jgi:hypothetical protein
MKEKIGPENKVLRELRVEIGVKESKLKHICELIANTGNISIDAIIPDRAGYYIKPGASVATGGDLYAGFVAPDKYRDEWSKKIDPALGGKTANDIIKTTNEMKKKLDKSLGTTQGDLSEMLSTLIELNTIQVVNMLFAKPRNIWYSPDLRIKPNPDESSKWILFRLDKTKIISGRAFSKFQKELREPSVDDAGGGNVGVSRLQCILDKKYTNSVPPIDIRGLGGGDVATPFLIFIIATQPFPPRMLDKDNLKDATDIMFDDPSFAPAADSGAAGAAAGAAEGAAGGIIENGSDMKGAMANTINKIKGKILPTKESCATGKDAILNAGKDLNDSFNKTLGRIGGELGQKIGDFLQKAPPPPPPAMIPPPLPPPPPSAAALAALAAIIPPPPPPPAIIPPPPAIAPVIAILPPLIPPPPPGGGGAAAAAQQAAAAAVAQQVAAAAAAAAAVVAAQQAAAQQAAQQALAVAQQALAVAQQRTQLSDQLINQAQALPAQNPTQQQLLNVSGLTIQGAIDAGNQIIASAQAAQVATAAAAAQAGCAPGSPLPPQLQQLAGQLQLESVNLTQRQSELQYHTFNLQFLELTADRNLPQLQPTPQHFQRLIDKATLLRRNIQAYNAALGGGLIDQRITLLNYALSQIIPGIQAAADAAAAQQTAQQEQDHIGFLGRIDVCVDRIRTVLQIEPLPPVLAVTSVVLRGKIINELNNIASKLINTAPVADNILTVAGVSGLIERASQTLTDALSEINQDLSGCQTQQFNAAKDAVITVIQKRLADLDVFPGELRRAMNDGVLANIKGAIQNIVNDITTIPPITQNVVVNICEYLTGRANYIQRQNEEANSNPIHNIDDIITRLNALKLEHARCMGGQTAALTAALAYLQQLNTTCATLKLPPPHQSQNPPATIADANTQISECLNALIGYLNKNTFLNPMVSNTLTELEKAFIATELRGKLVSQLADNVVDQCKDTNITDKIKSDMETLIDRVSGEVQRLATTISRGNITGRFETQIQYVLTSLQTEEQALRNINLDYKLLKPSSDFLKQIGDIRANLPRELTDDFNQRTGGLRTEIDAFVLDSFTKISQCRQDESTAAAERAAKDAQDRKLNEYLKALRQVSSGILPPPALGAPVEVKINSGLKLLLGKINTDINEKTQLANQSKQTIDGLINSIDAKNEELRKFIQNRLDICNDTAIVAKNKHSLEAIISQLNDEGVQLRILSLEIARKLPQLETNHAAIIAKIQTDITKLNSPTTLAALDPPTITAIGKDMDGLKTRYDELNKKSVGKLTEVTAIYTSNDTTAKTMKQKIEECIQTRKAVAAAWQNTAVDSIAKMKPIASECKARIDALCKLTDTDTINKVDATNPARGGLTARLGALKQSCSAFNVRLRDMVPSLYDVPPTASSIEKIGESISVYQQGLGNPAIGLAQLNQQYDTASASVNTLTVNKTALETMVGKLTRYEGEIDAIKTDIGGVIAAQEEAAAAAAAAAADINVFDELKTTAFSGVSFNEQTGDLILSFGNAQQPLNLSGKELSRQPPSSPGKFGNEEADEESAPVKGSTRVGRARAAAATYSVVITPTSQFYKKLVLGKVPQDIWLSEIQLADLKAEFGAKKVNLIEGADASPKIDPADKLAIAKAAALNPVVVKSLLAGIPGIDGEFLKKYDILVRLCDKGSAAGVINELLIDKKQIIPTPAPGAAGFGLGLVIRKMPDTGEMKIIRINGSGGAAASRQVRIDDIILEGDGKQLTSLSEEQVSGALAGPAGSECVLRLKRRNGPGAEIITVKVRRIPPLPEPQKKGDPSIVNNILQKLGWNGVENKVWFNWDMNPDGGGHNLIGGLFSLFSYNARKKSDFLSKNCATNYVCMLNWIFLIALRLTNSESKMYTPVNIQELLNNIYVNVYGFVDSEVFFHKYFISPIPSSNPEYIIRVNKNLPKNVFGDATLATIISRIKGELQRSLDDSNTLPLSQPVSASSSRSTSPLGKPRTGEGPPVLMGGGHKKKTRRINRKIDSHHTIKKHSKRDSKRSEKGTRRRHHKLHAKGRVSRIKTIRSDPVYFSV